MVTIKSIKKKLTAVKRTRRIRKGILIEEVLTDIVTLLDRLGLDVETSEVADALGKEDEDASSMSV